MKPRKVPSFDPEEALEAALEVLHAAALHYGELSHSDLKDPKALGTLKQIATRQLQMAARHYYRLLALIGPRRKVGIIDTA